MKLSEPVLMIVMLLGLLGAIQGLHLQQHDKYCKTESEWRAQYPDIDWEEYWYITQWL